MLYIRRPSKSQQKTENGCFTGLSCCTPRAFLWYLLPITNALAHLQVAELADANMALRVGAGRTEQLLVQTRRAMELRNAEILRLREAQLPAGCPASDVPPDSTLQLHGREVKGARAAGLPPPDQGGEAKQARQLRAALAASEAQRARDGAAHDAELAALHSAHQEQVAVLRGSLAAAHAESAAGSTQQQQQQQQQPHKQQPKQQQQQQQQQQQRAAGSGPRTPETGACWRRPVLSLSSEEAAPLETRASAATGRAAAARGGRCARCQEGGGRAAGARC